MAVAKELPDQARLIARLSYNPISGQLSWLNRPLSDFPGTKGHRNWNRLYAGKFAGYASMKGYVILKIDGQAYKAHRIIVKMMTGEDPPVVVDHENTKKSDNSWDNLRIATRSHNARNGAVRSNNTTGFKGVSINKGQYMATIHVNGRNKNLGRFHTPELAHAAYCAAAREHFGEFWNPG